MDATSVVTILGGLGMFLLGIHHLTEGLKDLAGDSLRRALQRLVSGTLSAIVSGVVFTVLIQSSTAAILTVIGFVSAGLMTFAQSIGVIMGATLGTTSTPWMVAFFGFRVRISSFAMPMLGVGGLLWLVGKGRARSVGALLAGFGLLFTGIDYMQTGMEGVTWSFERFTGPGSMWILFGIGVAMTIVMQSSSAAAATTLVALNAGALSFEQGCALIVGQSVGGTGTTALVMIGAGLAVRRAALAHILFNTAVGVLGMLFLSPLTAAADWVGSQLDDPDGVLALAAFSSIFKFAGIAVLYPFVDRFSRLLERITGGGASESAVGHLEPALYDAGASVALEAAWRALVEIARPALDAARGRLAGEAVAYAPPREDLARTVGFLESLSLETTDVGTIGPRLVRLAHALDHLRRLVEDLTRIPPLASDWQPPPGFSHAAEALAAWVEAATTLAVPPHGRVAAILAASKRVSEECRGARENIIEGFALQGTPAATARVALATLAWADAVVHDAARLVESLEAASGA
jgi:phosphate:Na+ symporter